MWFNDDLINNLGGIISYHLVSFAMIIFLCLVLGQFRWMHRGSSREHVPSQVLFHLPSHLLPGGDGPSGAR